MFYYCHHHYHCYDYSQARTAAPPPPGPQVVGLRLPPLDQEQKRGIKRTGFQRGNQRLFSLLPVLGLC